VAIWLRKVEAADFSLSDRIEVLWDRNITFDSVAS